MKLILPIVISLLCSCDVVKASLEAEAEVNGSYTETLEDTSSNDLDETDIPDDTDTPNENNQSGLFIQYKIVDCFVSTTGGTKTVEPDPVSVKEFFEESNEGGYLRGLPYFESNSYGDTCLYSRNGDELFLITDTNLLNTLPNGFVTGTAIYPYIKPL